MFRPTIEPGKARFIWLGTTRRFEAFTFLIRDTEHGLFQVHAYPFDQATSTFIVETDPDTWQRAGLDTRERRGQRRLPRGRCSPRSSQGHRLMTNKSAWINFRTISCERWSHGNDRAHRRRRPHGPLLDRLGHQAGDGGLDRAGPRARARNPTTSRPRCAAYHEARWLDVAKLQRAARVSQAWFEDISRYKHMAPEQLVLSMMTRSKRVTHGNLRVRDADYVAGVDRWFAASTAAPRSARRCSPRSRCAG